MIRRTIASGLWLLAAMAEGRASPCEHAARQAEQANVLPPGLLLAIGRVESGRWDAERQQRVPWPWSIDAGGQGRHFESKLEAERDVRALLDAGQRNIDVGCFQVNLKHHPTAFPSLDLALDPLANALYAGKFLADLRERTGSWEKAVAHYHSADPVRGEAYRQNVFAQWAIPLAGVPAAPTAAPPVAAPPMWPQPATGIRVWIPSAEGTAPHMIKLGPPR